MLMVAIVPASASAASPGKTLGVYAGPGAPDGVAQFESQLGRPVSFVADAFARDTWANLIDVDWWIGRWKASQYFSRVAYTVPMLPDEGGTLAQGASGQFNGYFRTLAERLVAGGQGSATLRLGWEFNGDWYKWSIKGGQGATYAAYWRQIVTTMRSVPGAHFKFDWCANSGSSYVGGTQLEAETAWPGSSYVDFVGLDVYDQSWIDDRSNADARWNGYLNDQNGLKWQRDFAARMGKPMTFPEWGLSNRHDGYGGGDAPAFIEHMHAWIKANNVDHHMYFNWADVNSDYRIFRGDTPRAAQRFRELFGTDAGDNDGASTGSEGTAPARLYVKGVKISRTSRRLRIDATLAPQASGAARITLSAGGHTARFSKRVSGGRLRVSQRISRGMARKGTGTVTVSYGGDAATHSQKVRLRVGSRKSKLRPLAGPRIGANQLAAAGSINKRARGAVRIELNFDVAGKNVTRAFSAKIRGGRWSLATQLPADVLAQLGQRTGGVTASAIFTGSGKVSGAMKLYDVLGAR
ncbi:MAG: hypothetical protein QOG15_3120 [Solirubrobacteraceae bacterium]|jgi:hypothetical protein|nr:hypothetical protein [Solirubrobacteraceae bacterium]